MITGISHVNIQVRDVKKAVEFYTQKLGMALAVEDPIVGRYEVAATRVATPRLSICPCEEPGFEGEDTGIILSVKDIKATYETLKKNGVRITVPYQAHGEWWAGFKDLDGNSYGLNEK